MSIKPKIIGLPYEEGAYWRKGMKEGPEAVWEQLKKMRRYSVAAGKKLEWDFEDIYSGNLDLCPYQKDTCLQKIEQSVKEVLCSGCAPVILGGDHSVTLPVIRAISKHMGNREFSIIQFDAHSDTFNHVEGYEYHHGAVFRNVVEEGLVLPENIYQFGIRGQVRDNGMEFVDKQGVNCIAMKDFRSKECSIKNYNLPKDKLYYVSIDIDVVDPAFAPGTGVPVPGGLTSFEILDIVEQLKDYNLIGFDVVEVAPIYDPADITSLLAANIAFELLVQGRFVSF